MAAPAEQSAANDEVVCKREKVTGSRFTKKVCFRKADTADQRYRERLAVEQAQRSRFGSN